MFKPFACFVNTGSLGTFTCINYRKARPYKKKILVLRHRHALKIPPDETFLSLEGKKK